MATVRRYQSLGPLLSGEGSRAFLGLSVSDQASEPPFPVVLIWFPKDILKDKARLDVALKETRRAAQIEHPNIVKVFGLTTQKEGLARVVEYANAESLRRVLEAAGRLPPDIAARVVADAATGVHYGHMAGNDDGTPLVHGDLRPQTLLVTYGGVTKVSGYGGLAAAPREVGGRRVPGRRHHCAPEQVLGGRNAINVQTDVYLLGLVLYECLTGKVPFEDEKSEQAFDQAVLNRPLPALPATIPEPLRAVVEKAMAKKAFDRYPTALAFREALEQAAQALVPTEEVGAFIGKLFPEDHPTRAARKRLVDRGLQSVASYASLPAEPADPAAPEPQQAPLPAMPAVPPVVPRSAAPPPPPAPPPAAAPAPQPPAPAPVVPLFASSARQPSEGGARRAVLATVLGAVALAVAAGVLFVREKGWPGGMDPDLAATAGAADDAGAPDAGEPDAGLADGGEPDGGEDAGVDAGYDPDSGIPALDLFVEPVVNVSLDGQPIGRTPLLYWPAPPGRRSLYLTGKGVSVAKSVVIADAGITRHEIYLARGYITVNAPDGAEVSLDGRALGPAPLKDVSVYEGSHRLVVTVNESRWEEAFNIAPNERLRFTVDFE
jgi:serine/threonine-protein kinase